MPMPTWFLIEKRNLNRLPPSQRTGAWRALWSRLVAEWDSAGTCLKCGSPRERGSHCLDHAIRQSVYNERHRARLREAGLCMICGGAFAAGGRVQCRECLDRCAARAREDRDEKIRLGLCSKCKGERDGPHRDCQSCRVAHGERVKRLRDERRAAGLCPTCGATRDGGTLQCSACVKRRRPRGDEALLAAMKLVLDREEEGARPGGVMVIDAEYLEARDLVMRRVI